MAQAASIAREESWSRSVRPVDLVHLAKQCMGDAKLEREILHLFDGMIATYHARLDLSGPSGQAMMVLHAMRGAAGGVGAFVVADHSRAIEDELRAGRAVTRQQLAELGIAVSDVRAFIADMLAQDPV